MATSEQERTLHKIGRKERRHLLYLGREGVAWTGIVVQIMGKRDKFIHEILRKQKQQHKGSNCVDGTNSSCHLQSTIQSGWDVIHLVLTTAQETLRGCRNTFEVIYIAAGRVRTGTQRVSRGTISHPHPYPLPPQVTVFCVC